MRSSTCVLRRELIVDAAIFPAVRSCRYCAICPGKASSWRAGGGLRGLVVLAGRAGVRDQPLLLRLPEPTEFLRPRAAVHPAEERGQVVGVAGQGVDRRLREVRVTTQPAAGYAYAHEHVLTEQLLQPRAQLDRLLLRGIGGHLHTAHAIRRGRPGSRRGSGRPRRVARRAAAGAEHECADHDRSGRAHLARTGGAGAAPDRRSRPYQGPYHCHHPPRDLARTALLKCMTGG